MNRNLPKIKLVLAFDHELSLGGTSSFERDLFEPADRLLDLAAEIAVPVVFFTDVLSGIKHAEWGVEAFAGPYRAQLARAISEGHDVQLHLHPHWLDSRWESGKFRPSRSFALADFRSAPAPNDIPGIVARGVAYLRDVCAGVDPNYRCIAFRAGGYNMTGDTGLILRSLYDNGIRIDSSIIRGYYFRSGISEIDFRRVTRKANWFIPLSGPIDAVAKESEFPAMFEVPIASAPRTPLNNLPFLARRVVHRKRRPASVGYSIHDGSTSRSEKLMRLLPFSAWTLSFDDFANSAADAMSIFRRYVDDHSGETEIICATVSHPKSMGAHARSVMKGFVESARGEYGNRLEFHTFTTVPLPNVTSKALP